MLRTEKQSVPRLIANSRNFKILRDLNHMRHVTRCELGRIQAITNPTPLEVGQILENTIAVQSSINTFARTFVTPLLIETFGIQHQDVNGYDLVTINDDYSRITKLTEAKNFTNTTLCAAHIHQKICALNAFNKFKPDVLSADLVFEFAVNKQTMVTTNASECGKVLLDILAPHIDKNLTNASFTIKRYHFKEEDVSRIVEVKEEDVSRMVVAADGEVVTHMIAEDEEVVSRIELVADEDVSRIVEVNEEVVSRMVDQAEVVVPERQHKKRQRSSSGEIVQASAEVFKLFSDRKWVKTKIDPESVRVPCNTCQANNTIPVLLANGNGRTHNCSGVRRG
jgi:hypothetical protein